jgi:DNA-binding transcriptional LysR family regulator
MDLQALADFNLVAAHGGFGRAGRITGRSKATLSRRVAELEQSLGVRLIERGAHMLRLTEEGRALHERTEGLLDEITEAGESIISGASIPRGRLRVSAPVVFAHVALGRIGARFAQAFPQVDLEIVAEDKLVDPVDDGYDLVIRIDPAPDDRLVGRQILSDERLLVASPAVPSPLAGSEAKEELRVKAVLMTATPSETKWRVRTDARGVRLVHPEPMLRLSSLLMVRDAVVAGAGLLPKLLVADDLKTGRLVCWATDDNPPVAIWALQSSRRLVGAKVRAFLDALAAAFPDKVFDPGRLSAGGPR